MCSKVSRMLVFVICGIIKNVLPNSYFILEFFHVKSFEMMHFMSLHFDFSVRYSWKYIEKLIELRLLSDYYPDLFLSFVALLRIFYQILISYFKFNLKWGMLPLCKIFSKIFIKCFKNSILLSWLVFVICGFIKNFIPNSYFILEIYHAKSFKMRYVTSRYFNFSVRYS